MKLKIIILATGAIIGFSSCEKKKDYTCTCTINPAGGTPYTADHVYTNTTMSEASDKCTQAGKTGISGGGGTYKCNVK